jgi:hypothetical protein
LKTEPITLKEIGSASEDIRKLVGVFAHKFDAHHLQLLEAHIAVAKFF